MRKNTITGTHAHGKSPYATVQLKSSDIQPRDRKFLREWANRLNVSIEVLLKRMLIAAVIGQQYVEKIPEM